MAKETRRLKLAPLKYGKFDQSLPPTNLPVLLISPVMKCSLVLVLACVAGVNAFLPAAAPRMAVQRSMTMLQKPASLQVAKSSMMALKQSESATIVASETKTSLLDKVWNKNTKLTIYLAIWYLGNIYCTSSFFCMMLFFVSPMVVRH